MPDSESIKAFLRVAREDPVFSNRLAAIEVLTFLPLPVEAWRALAPVAADLLANAPASGSEAERTIRACARIPVRSIREYMGAITRDRGHPLSLSCARELALRGDPSGLERLLADLEESIERLACLPLERLQVSREPFDRALSAQDPNVRFWAAVALARLGELEPLERVFDALMSGGPETPPLFWGNPWTPYSALAAARPLPAREHSFLVGLYNHELTRLRERDGAYARLPRDAVLLIGGLTGIIDEYGEPRTEQTRVQPPPAEPAGQADPALAEAVARRLSDCPFDEHLDINVEPEMHKALGALRPERAGELMMAALDYLEKRARASESPEAANIFATNAMADFAGALPAPVALPLASLVENLSERWPHLPAGATTWVLARAGADILASEFAPRILAADESEKSYWLAWAGRIATQLNAPPPSAGAGPESAESMETGELIDDTLGAAPTQAAEPPASAPPEPEAAPPAKVEPGGREEEAAPLPAAPRPKPHVTTPPAKVEPGGREEAPPPPPPPRPKLRYIQAKVRRIQGGEPTGDPPVWIAAVPHLVRVRIGPSEKGWISPTKRTRFPIHFPYELLPRAKSHRLRVILSEPRHLDAPLVRSIKIRTSGPSEEAEFSITPRAGFDSLTARVVVAHRNRILQTALLAGRVVSQEGQEQPGDRIEVEIESVVRPSLEDLRSHRRFDMALAVNHTRQGTPQLLALAEERAVVRGLQQIEKKIGAISSRLSRVAQSAESYAGGLEGDDGLELLRFLADKGRAIYDFLIEDQLIGDRFKNSPLLQIVNLTPDAYFPAEFVYDFGLPAEGARLCEAALEVFKKHDFTHTCRQRDHAEADNPVVCPFGFWGLRRVIERHACLPRDREQIVGDFVLQAEPVRGRKTVLLTGNAIFGASAHVEEERAGATAALHDGLLAVSPLAIARVGKWAEWKAQIENRSPSLIIALPHAEVESEEGEDEDTEYFLEIGGERQKARVIGQTAAHYVLAREDAPAPVVLLLGCNTSTPKTPIDSIVGHFRRAGAAIVVGTVGSVLGSHAAQVAMEMVEALFKETAGRPRPLGELLRDVRCRCIGRGVLMALCVAAFGDADWQVRSVEKGRTEKTRRDYVSN